MSNPKKKSQSKCQPGKAKQQSVFQEAWDNMSEDFNKLLPEKLRNQDKKKFALWLFILEVVVLGVIGTLVYEWWVGS